MNKFKEEDIVNHNKYGVGKVIRIKDPGIEVSFCDYGDKDILTDALTLNSTSSKYHFWPKSVKYPKVDYKNQKSLNSCIEIGVLGFVKYKTGQNGESATVRRKILNCIFYNKIPKVHSIEYMNLWGKPKSKKRFEQIKRSIYDAKRSNTLDSNRDRDDDLKWIELQVKNNNWEFD
jgi:hypothetical protein